MSDASDEPDAPRRPPPPWGDEITPLTEVCGGQYVLLDEIARGDLSIVYRAKPSGSRDVIAFKLIQPRYIDDQTQVRRFRREAELLRRIEHPNVVRLLDHGSIEDGRDFVALEMLAGRTLREALSEAERMPPERTCRIARQIARAVRVMHKAGVIHRDLRPENILVIGPEDGERVKLLDFSAAGDVGAPARRVKTDSLDASESPEGPRYHPPEQERGRPPQPTMDVYALGVVMFEMLTGQHPFVQSQDKLGQTIRSKAFDAPEVFLGLVSDCIEDKPRERPQSMDEVLERIDKALLWMGVVPHEVANPVDEDERTQPYAVADPGHVDKDERERKEAAQAEEAPEARAPHSRSKDPRDGASVAGEVILSPNDPFDEDVIQTQRRRVYRDDEGDEDDDQQPTQRRRLGSNQPQEPAERLTPESWDDGPEPNADSADSWDEARAARSTSESWDDSPSSDSGTDRAYGDSDGDGVPGARRREPGAAQTRSAHGSDSSRARRARRGRNRARSTRRTPESWDESRASDSGTDRARNGRRTPESWDESRPPPDPRRARRARANADGPKSDSVPHIDPEDLREKGAPTGPRFIVDTVAWTKQQPSAKPQRERRRHIKNDDGSDASQSKGSRPRARPPTAARAPVDPALDMPRWVLPLLILVIVVLAYAVYVVWTH